MPLCFVFVSIHILEVGIPCLVLCSSIDVVPYPRIVFVFSQAAVLHVFTAEGRNHYCYVEDRAVVDSELEAPSVASSSSSPASSTSSAPSSVAAAVNSASGSTASSNAGAGPGAPFVHNAKPLSAEFKRELRATIAASAARFRSQQRDAQATRARQSGRLGSGARSGTGAGAASTASDAAGAAAVDAAKLLREAREKSEHEDEQTRLAARRRAALLATL